MLDEVNQIFVVDPEETVLTTSTTNSDISATSSYTATTSKVIEEVPLPFVFVKSIKESNSVSPTKHWGLRGSGVF
jgi:hypothetical protein